jgi:GT2 family glycosyltransferase
VLLFTDDDVEVQSGWIDALVDPFADHAVAAVGGRVIPTFLGERPGWLTDDGIFAPVTLGDYGTEPFLFSEDRHPLGANMALRASVLANDPFDVRLGHTGKLALGYDEYLLLGRLAREHKVGYAPNAVVRHLLDADRLTAENARRTVFQIGFGSARYRRILGERAASLPRRLVRTGRAWRRARAATAGSDRTIEMRAWLDTGYQTEWLLGTRLRWLADIVAARGYRWH